MCDLGIKDFVKKVVFEKKSAVVNMKKQKNSKKTACEELIILNPYKPSVLLMGHQQTVQDQIRCHRVRHLIRFITVC